MSDQPLSTLTLMVTRPQQQAQPLIQQLKQLGAKVIGFPAMRIEPIQEPKLSRLFTSHYDAVIVVSRNAVTYSKQYWTAAFKQQHFFAVGPSTSAALQQSDITEVNVPHSFSSEGLLALPALSNCQGKRFLIICGQSTRGLLADTLQQRGATVTHAVCYAQQLANKPSSSGLTSLRQQPIDYIIVTSQQLLTNLYQLLPINWLNQQSFLVINQTMPTLLQQLGNQRPTLISTNATDVAIIDCLYQHNS